MKSTKTTKCKNGVNKTTKTVRVKESVGEQYVMYQ